MRRTTAAIVGTLGGTALLLAAKFGTGSGLGTGAAATDQAAGQSGDVIPEGNVTDPPAAGNGNGNNAKKPRKKKGANGLKNGVFRGAPAENQYGRIQVTIRVANGRITAIAATHGTTPAMTLKVNQRAIPILRQEALQAQNAQIDTVSGATYSSGSFKTSLRSAIQQAKA
jgi:uncharacterized protein with FMN-binding domain